MTTTVVAYGVYFSFDVVVCKIGLLIDIIKYLYWWGKNMFKKHFIVMNQFLPVKQIKENLIERRPAAFCCQHPQSSSSRSSHYACLFRMFARCNIQEPCLTIAI